LSTLNSTRNALKFNPLLFYEKAATNGTKYSKAIVTPAVEMLHEDSKIMICYEYVYIQIRSFYNMKQILFNVD